MLDGKTDCWRSTKCCLCEQIKQYDTFRGFVMIIVVDVIFRKIELKIQNFLCSRMALLERTLHCWSQGAPKATIFRALNMTHFQIWCIRDIFGRRFLLTFGLSGVKFLRRCFWFVQAIPLLSIDGGSFGFRLIKTINICSLVSLFDNGFRKLSKRKFLR